MKSTRTTFCGECRALRWVEDWSEMRDEMLAIVLGPCGHTVERTPRLGWAHGRGAERTPDLVIADLVMPGIDGMELLVRLKREFPTTPVLILTGQGSIESAVQAIKDGAYDYLTKPVDPTRLQFLLDRALER